MVANGSFGDVVNIYVAENTTHTEHILTFEVATIAPAENLNSEAVAAVGEVLADIELSHVVASLRVANILAVHPNESSRVDTIEVEECSAILIVSWRVEVGYVRTHGVYPVVFTAIVVTRTGIDERRRIGMRVFYIAIKRCIIPLHLPIRGNRDGVPCSFVETIFPEIHGAFAGLGNKVKLPHTIQQAEMAVSLRIEPRTVVESLVCQHFRLCCVGEISSHALFFIDGKDGFVLPFVLLELRLISQLKAKPRLLVFGIVFHQFETTINKGVHCALTFCASRNKAVNICLPTDGFKEEAGVAPCAALGGPL